MQIVLFSLLIIAFFLFVYVYNLREIYEIKGRISATHGRYWFPLIPLLGIAYIYPAYKKYLLKGNWLILTVAVLACLETGFFLREAIPFYLI